MESGASQVPTPSDAEKCNVRLESLRVLSGAVWGLLLRSGISKAAVRRNKYGELTKSIESRNQLTRPRSRKDDDLIEHSIGIFCIVEQDAHNTSPPEASGQIARTACAGASD